jgi:hypothetical protein
MTIKLQSLMVLCDGAVHRPSEELVLSCPVGGSDLPDLLSKTHRRHFPLGGYVTTSATRETTSNAGILLRCWVMFSLVKYTLGIVLVTK